MYIFIHNLTGNHQKMMQILMIVICVLSYSVYLHNFFFLFLLQVTIFLCSGWIIIILTISPIYLMLMISDDRHVMAVCWFKRINLRMEWERNFDKEYYWWEIQVLLTTLLTIFLPIILIVACNVKVLQIGKEYAKKNIIAQIKQFLLTQKLHIFVVANDNFFLGV